MSKIASIIRFELRDLFRGFWLLAYLGFFVVLTSGIFLLGGVGPSALVSLVQVVLIFIPLASILFGTVYLYGSQEFIQLLLTQPVGRRQLFLGLFSGLAVPLGLAFLLGTLAPMIAFGMFARTGLWSPVILLLTGAILTIVFLSLAFAIVIGVQDRVRGLSLAIGTWLFFAVIYDGILLFLAYTFGNYPIERMMVVAAMLNPVDLSRIILLLQFDISALMGYTGAVFEEFFGSAAGILISGSALLLWTGLPLLLAYRLFRKNDF